MALGVEDLAQGGGDHAALGRAAVLVHIPDEVDGAALPGAAQHPGDRPLQPLVGIGGAEAHVGEAAGAQAAQELDPEGARLDLADVEVDHLAAP